MRSHLLRSGHIEYFHVGAAMERVMQFIQFRKVFVGDVPHAGTNIVQGHFLGSSTLSNANIGPPTLTATFLVSTYGIMINFSCGHMSFNQEATFHPNLDIFISSGYRSNREND